MGGSWARSGSAARSSGPRPVESWAAAVDRARATWDALTGGPARCVCIGEHHPGVCRAGTYSDAAAAAILSAALGLWGDTARALTE